MVGRRIAAMAALCSTGVTFAAAVIGIVRYPGVVIALFVALAAGLEGVVLVLTTRGWKRALGVLLVAGAAIVSVAVVIRGEALGLVITMIASGLITTILAVVALRRRPYRPPAEDTPPPSRPFILMNPRSGGGKVRRFDLDERARRMGAQVAYLEPGLDAVGTLEQAVRDGADLLGAAGGDGTQALVAQVAADHDLPMLCIPAGTRNHFAIDLGLDQSDPRTALDALTEDGEEIRIDLGEAGGRPFVNNVSLGAYAEIVARPHYRDAKIETALETLPDVADPAARSNLILEDASHDPIEDPQLVQVTNNPYATPDEPPPSGSRTRLDSGRLGVYVVAYRTSAELRQLVSATTRSVPERASSYHTWTGSSLRIVSRVGSVRAGVDGEAVDFASPLDIAIRPGVLRVRVPKDRPGQRVGWPRIERPLVLLELWSIAFGSSRTTGGTSTS
jgi:diacylglycerol kinase family enzyme